MGTELCSFDHRKGLGMTYNEFMENFKAYIRVRLDDKIGEYGSANNFATEYDISPATLSRIRAGKGVHLSEKKIRKLLGDDIFDVDVDDAKALERQLEIERLEKRLAELKREQNQKG